MPAAWRTRSALVGGACALASACVPGGAPEVSASRAGLLVDAPDLDPAPGRVRVALRAERRSDGTYAYSGRQPGPTIRAQLGDEVEVEVENALDVPTTVHWHGVGVPFDMDGVPGMQAPIAPGARFTYRFPVEKAGTFWYHPHFDTARQVDLGLYGLFVVEDPSHPAVDAAVELVLDDPFELERHPVHGYEKSERTWQVNGAPAPLELGPAAGSTVRVRILDASNAAYLWLEARGLAARWIAGDQGFDGGPRPGPRHLLAPGDRAELELRVGGEAGALVAYPWSLNGGPSTWGAPVELVRVRPRGAPTAPPPETTWPFDGRAPSADPGRTDIVWSFLGSDRSGFWTIDGERFPDVTVERARVGEPLVVELRNLSPTEHPFHLHAGAFEILSVDGRAPTTRWVEDTVNVRIRERVRLLFTPTRPGMWMAHCHILPHAEEGMMTTLEVEP